MNFADKGSETHHQSIPAAPGTGHVPSITVRDAALAWLAESRSGASSQMQELYEMVVHQVLLPVLGTRTMASLDPEDIRRLDDKLQLARGRKNRLLTADTLVAARLAVRAALGRTSVDVPGCSVVPRNSELRPLQVLQLAIHFAPPRWAEFLAAQAILGSSADRVAGLLHGDGALIDLLADAPPTPMGWALAPFLADASHGKPIFRLADGTLMTAALFEDAVWPSLSALLGLQPSYALDPAAIAKQARSRIRKLQAGSKDAFWQNLQLYSPIYIARWLDTQLETSPPVSWAPSPRTWNTLSAWWTTGARTATTARRSPPGAPVLRSGGRPCAPAKEPLGWPGPAWTIPGTWSRRGRFCTRRSRASASTP